MQLEVQADPVPQQLRRELAHVDAVHEHRTLADVDEPGNEVDECCLARARAADDRGRGARRTAERQIGEDRVLGPGIAEARAAQHREARIG